ncbi:MAG: hypothetical protein C4329_11295 [Chitinophagaceae bacterium]
MVYSLGSLKEAKVWQLFGKDCDYIIEDIYQRFYKGCDQ